MNTRIIFATLTISATAIGLLAQDNVVIRRGVNTTDDFGPVTIAQAGVGMMAFPDGPGNVRFMTQEFSFNGRPVTNAPYSADEKTESVQTLADGNRITNTTTARVYRDSQGRTRREMTLPGFGGDAPHTLITINDPIAGVNYTFDPDVKVAHQAPPMMAKLRAEADASIKAVLAKGSMEPGPNFIRRAPAPNVKHEDLGENVIEGINAKGTRETSTIDAGAMGNERPISITSERWFSPDLQVEVKSVHDDPRMGQTTHTLTNISRSEPDPSLFQLPADYKTDDGKAGAIRKFEFHSNQ